MKSSFSKQGIDSAAELLRTACQSGGSPGLWRELVWGRCRHVIVLTECPNTGSLAGWLAGWLIRYCGDCRPAD